MDDARLKPLLFRVDQFHDFSSLASPAKESRPNIPQDDKPVKEFELPLARCERSPRYVSEEEYYKLTRRPINRSYLAYLRSKNHRNTSND